MPAAWYVPTVLQMYSWVLYVGTCLVRLGLHNKKYGTVNMDVPSYLSSNFLTQQKCDNTNCFVFPFLLATLLYRT